MQRFPQTAFWMILLAAVIVAVALPLPTLAATCDETTIGTILPSCACEGRGPCQLRDFLSMIINFSNWMLGMLSGLAVLFMISAAWNLTTSAGNQEKRMQGIKALQNILIGAGFMLGGYILVNAVILGLKGSVSDSTLFSSREPWNKIYSSAEICESRRGKNGEPRGCFDETWWHQQGYDDEQCAAPESGECAGKGRRCCNVPQ